MTTDDQRLTADRIWQREVDDVPELRAALVEVGDAGRKARSRARKAAADLEADQLTEGEIALALQAAAAQGARRREAIDAAHIRLRNEVLWGAVRSTARQRRWRMPEPEERVPLAVTIVTLLVTLIGPALLMEGPRADGPFLTVDEGAIWSGLISLIGAIGWLSIRDITRKAGSPPFRLMLGSVILTLFTGVAALIVVLQMGDPSAEVLAGLVALVAATVLHAVTAYLFGRRPDPLPQTLRELEAAISPESRHDAVVRRAGYAEAVLVLLQRDAIDDATARQLLRVYAG